MNRMIRYFGALIIGAFLLVPTWLKAGTNLSEGVQIKKVAQVSIQVKTRRYYDPYHKDYHAWNGDEDRAYRHWATEERHETQVRDFNRLKRQQQGEYWRWRHDHADWR